jgi:hypothetical protein
VPVPLVRLNEVLTSPGRVDWNQDGLVDLSDQWIELFNGGKVTTDLGGWSVQVVAAPPGASGSGKSRTALPPAIMPALPASSERTPSTEGATSYVFPAKTLLTPGAYLLLDSAETGLRMSQGQWLLLVAPDGKVRDSVLLVPVKPDGSYSRDNLNEWHKDWTPSPGDANQPGTRNRNPIS